MATTRSVATTSSVTPDQIDRALAAWDNYVMECNGRRAAASMTLYGHTGASIPDESPSRREAMRLALEAANAS